MIGMISLATVWSRSTQATDFAGASGRRMVCSIFVSVRAPSGRSTDALSPTTESIAIDSRLSA